MDPLASLIVRLPSGAVTTHYGELLSRAHDRWPLALLRDVRGDRVPPPAAVVFASDPEHVATVLGWAEETGTAVVVRGGGSGVVGGAQALPRSVVLDLSRMKRIVGVDDVSQTVQAEAGVRGADLEAALAHQGLTLGHEVESLAVSTVGGWIGSASAGYASPGFGAIEDMVLGLTVVASGGRVVRLKPVPRSAAGPDLRRLFVGSEGGLGVVVEATLAASRLPAGYAWEVFRPHSFESGMALTREIVQRRYRTLVVRLLDEPAAVAEFSGLGHRGALLILGFDAGAPAIDAERFDLRRLARELGGTGLGPELGDHWWMHRYDPVARQGEVMGPERALGQGVIEDTLEVAALWRRLPRLYEEVRGALLDHAERVACHVAHPRGSGAAMRFSFVIKAEDDREVEAAYRQAVDEALSRALDGGGTVSHHGGVGVLKAPFLAEEVGEDGAWFLGALKRGVDPSGVLNPGKAFPFPEAAAEPAAHADGDGS